MKERKVFGYIYRISHPDIPNKCYIGKTELNIKKRWDSHIIEMKQKSKKEFSFGDGKLHSVMKSYPPSTFIVEEVAQAYSSKELFEKEGFYQEKYDSIRNGWNKKTAPKNPQKRGKKIKIKIKGKEIKSESLASLCRELEISNSTLNYWRKRCKNLSDAVKKALASRNLSQNKEKLVVHRKTFKNVAELARSRLNKQNLHPSTIRSRFRKGFSYEEALKQKKRLPKEFEIEIEKGKTLHFENVQSAHNKLSKTLKEVPPYSSVISALSKGHSPEQAFGIVQPKWKKDFEWINKLQKEENYRLTGELKPSSNPIIDKTNKEIFASKKVFAQEYGFDYTTIVAELKRGLSVQQIIQKRD